MTIDIDEKNLKSGLLGLIVALVDVIQEVLEREAVRRMGSGLLKEDEIDRLGAGLMELDAVLERIKEENDLHEVVGEVRLELDSLVEQSLNLIIDPERSLEAKF